jgi:Icc-related predicted phosphoesterase
MRMRILGLLPRLIWNRLVHGRYLDILLTHAAPSGLNDRPDPAHVGFEAFVRFIERYKPKYLLHGHVHLYDINARRSVRHGETEIINVYDHYVLDCPLEPA